MKSLFYLAMFSTAFICGCSKPKAPNKIPPIKIEPTKITTPRPSPKLEWNKELVILDPGHGGIDPGCVHADGGKLAVEDEYAYDVCCRAKTYLEAKGYKVVFTIIDKVTKYEEREIAFIPPDLNEVLVASPDLIPRGRDKKSMNLRIKAATDAVTKFKPKKIFWISVHIDAVPDTSLQGAHIVTPYAGNFTQSMIRSLKEKELLRQKDGLEYHPVGLNGMPRKLYLLRPDKNPFRSCLLLELGNIKNDTDRNRMFEPESRNKWAEGISDGVFKASALPPQLSSTR